MQVYSTFFFLLLSFSFSQNERECERFNSEAIKYFFTGEPSIESEKALQLLKYSGFGMYEFGDFNKCISLPFGEYFRFSFNRADKIAPFGLCLYKECSITQVRHFILYFRSKLQSYFPNSRIPLFQVTRPRRDDLKINQPAGNFGFILIFLFIIGINLVSFLKVNIFHSNSYFFLLFDPLTNTKSLLKPYPPSKTSCLNGIRFISMFCVTYGHVILLTLNLDQLKNISEDRIVVRTLFSALSFSSFYAIDVFFLLSGFLFRLNMSQNSLIKGENSVFKKIFFPVILRYLRILPLLVVNVFGMSNLVFYLGTGLFQDYSQFVCLEGQRRVWHIFLFFNNFTGVKCQDHLWYLATDMQLFCFSLLVIVLFRQRKTQDRIFVFLLFISVLVSLTVSWAKNLGYNKIIFQDEEDSDFSAVMYDKPYIRGQPYLIGLIFSNFYFDYCENTESGYNSVNRRLIKSRLSRIVYFLGGIGCLACIPLVGYWGNNLEQRMDPLVAAVLNAVLKSVFVVGVAVCIHLSFLGKFPSFDKFMSSSFFSFFTKIGYSIYMFHFSFIILFIMNTNSAFHGSFKGFFTLSLAVFGLSSVFGLIVTAVFDSPVAKTINRLVKK